MQTGREAEQLLLLSLWLSFSFNPCRRHQAYVQALCFAFEFLLGIINWNTIQHICSCNASLISAGKFLYHTLLRCPVPDMWLVLNAVCSNIPSVHSSPFQGFSLFPENAFTTIK